jgi:hypothetical protein
MAGCLEESANYSEAKARLDRALNHLLTVNEDYDAAMEYLTLALQVEQGIKDHNSELYQRAEHAEQRAAASADLAGRECDPAEKAWVDAGKKEEEARDEYCKCIDKEKGGGGDKPGLHSESNPARADDEDDDGDDGDDEIEAELESMLEEIEAELEEILALLEQELGGDDGEAERSISSDVALIS